MYCDKHRSLARPVKSTKTKRQANKMYNMYKRDKEANAFYHSREWANMSKSIKRQGFNTCECCGRTFDKKGYLVVDHIVPRRVDKSRQLDSNNLWILCKKCHWYKGLLESKVYQPNLFVENLDASKKWNKEKCRDWILEKRGGAYSDSEKSAPNESR